MTDDWLRVIGAPSVFALGDCSVIEDKPLPQTAQVGFVFAWTSNFACQLCLMTRPSWNKCTSHEAPSRAHLQHYTTPPTCSRRHSVWGASTSLAHRPNSETSTSKIAPAVGWSCALLPWRTPDRLLTQFTDPGLVAEANVSTVPPTFCVFCSRWRRSKAHTSPGSFLGGSSSRPACPKKAAPATKKAGPRGLRTPTAPPRTRKERTAKCPFLRSWG